MTTRPSDQQAVQAFLRLVRSHDTRSSRCSSCTLIDEQCETASTAASANDAYDLLVDRDAALRTEDENLDIV